MAYYKIDEKKFARLRKEAQQFKTDIICAVGTDFMRIIAEAENRMIIDILNGVESEATADVVEVVRCRECRFFTKGMAVGMCKRIEEKPILPCTYDNFCKYGERGD